MAAHELSGDVREFALLEHVDAGTPKTTDLDEAFEVASTKGERVDRSTGPSEGAKVADQPKSFDVKSERDDGGAATTARQDEFEEPQARARATIRKRTETTIVDELRKMDREDIITVRYLPISARRSVASRVAPQGNNGTQSEREIPEQVSAASRLASAASRLGEVGSSVENNEVSSDWLLNSFVGRACDFIVTTISGISHSHHKSLAL